jgi:hypothetical protein
VCVRTSREPGFEGAPSFAEFAKGGRQPTMMRQPGGRTAPFCDKFFFWVKLPVPAVSPSPGILLVVTSNQSLMNSPVKRKAALSTLVVFLAALTLQAQNPKKFPAPPKASRRQIISVRILDAKSIFLDNQTGYSAVGQEAVRELSDWGRFRIVGQDQAQLLMVLSTREYNGTEFPDADDFDPTVKLPRKPLNAFLTVIDKKTGDRLWIDSRPWGGLLTGSNSAGWRLIARFRKHVDHTPAPS